MAAATQAKILRVLQEREFEPVGGTETVEVDVRIIAATNADLENKIQEKTFREDLYYRLNVITVTIPSLHQRREDIPLLADHFLKKYAEKNRRLIKGFDPKVIDIFIRHQWPGNVRELENTIERAVIMARGDMITPVDLPDALKPDDTPQDDSSAALSGPMSLKEMEKEMIIRTLKETDGNRTHAAKILGISRRTLQLKIKAYGVQN